MKPSTISPRLRNQAAFTVAVVVVAGGLLAAIYWVSRPSGGLLSPRALVLVGTFLAAVAVDAAMWRRTRTTWLLSALLIVVAALSVVIMARQPNSGAPFAGWDGDLMACLLLLSGLILPLATRSSWRLVLAALTQLRFTIWFGAILQLAWLMLGGNFGKLFTANALALQLVLSALVGLGALLVVGGDRRWLATLTPADRSVSLARLLLPIMLIPLITALGMDVAVVRGLIAADVAPLLNVEISSIVLGFVILPTLRGMWRERAGRETLAHVLQRSPVVVHTHGGLIEYWPRGCEALYGFTAEEAVGRQMRDLVQTQFPQSVEIAEAILWGTGEWTGELRQVTKEGKTLWVASNIVVEGDRGDPGSKLVETLTDITALKIANSALQETTERLGQAIAAYDLGIVDYDTASGVTTFSPRMEQLLGLDHGPRRPGMRDLTRMMNRVDAAQLAQMTVEDVQTRKPQREFEIGIVWPDGQQRFLQSTTRYFYDAGGALERLVGIYMDITDKVRDRAEVAARGKRLLDLQSELAHTSRLSAMGEMAASLAHELNQPLTAIGTTVGAIEMMLRNADGPDPGGSRQKMLRAASHAEAQAVRAGEIVRRLREFIARGEADMQREDVAGLIDDALALALPNPAAAGVTVEKSIDPRAATVLADRVQIQQVMVNLIRNALEAMRGQSTPRRLIIGATLGPSAMAVISVADTGPGVKGADQADLFAAFVSSKSDGMGVGLSICRRIVEGHGGQMWFEPSDHGGAEFRFTLATSSGPAIIGEATDPG